ncbi:hypothetical protein Patl1_19718 [Pistacia atlantica]|uniref:Uncharacterized protein n=1 Tax=Pistacia atlantica TaxID=434234 RepID=A0ACC1C3V8_9ROSI|nr:hypothetical protein Patl1_19718 [Pistacia atlantica]
MVLCSALSGLLPNPELETAVLSISLDTTSAIWMIPFGLSGAARELVSICNKWGYAYSRDTEVVTYVATMNPILAASTFIDARQCVLSGVARGCGWQKIGAYVNLAS